MAIWDKFNKRFVGADIQAKDFARFNSIRHGILGSDKESAKYLEKKTDFIRMCFKIFIKRPEAFMDLAKEVSNE